MSLLTKPSVVSFIMGEEAAHQDRICSSLSVETFPDRTCMCVFSASGASHSQRRSSKPGSAARPQRDRVQEDQSARLRSFRHRVQGD